jgi:hypothetical protein
MRIVLIFSITALCGSEFSIYRRAFGGLEEKGWKTVFQAGARRLGQPLSPDAVFGPSSPDVHCSDKLPLRCVFL